MASSAFRAAGQTAARTSRYRNATQGLNDLPTTCLQLRNLPRTATPADLRRLCATMKVENIDNVTIDYDHGVPSGRAFLTTTKPQFTKDAVKGLRNGVVGGHLIYAHPIASIPIPFERGRGSRGRAEAGERGIVNGNGPGAGLARTDESRSVIITGLPISLSQDRIRAFVKSFNIDAGEGGQLDVVRVEPSSKLSATRYIIRAKTKAEAHRIVRRLHMTYYKPEHHGGKFLLRARIIY
ncbi:hypothetical protein OBBRIDRAFT_21814 [Obba rivulosa]|uniref:RRM domain-containing protein n=1 Tax=Obba rivulosa TaxID=1052685 RepID=A0A8E2J550_9APHY|nr:hypothetical protein OBBRIDRAFT_21814 [Obba rivulosa]